MFQSEAMPTRPHPHFIPRRPQGQPTRGKTAANRLRRVDNFLAQYAPALLRRAEGDFADALFVDVGYGAEATTTLESAARLRRINPSLGVLGVEIDPERVAAALPFADEQTFFRLGGFNLPLRPQAGATGKLEKVRAIRAFNVLRQYEESAVAAAWAMLGQALLPGGLLIEGTSDPLGRLWVANVLRQADEQAPLIGEALVFSTNFRSGFDPSDFQPVLPKNYIHRVLPAEPIYAFLQAWKQASLETIAWQAWGARQWFIAAGQQLAARGYPVDCSRRWLAQGYLIVRDLRPKLSESSR
jgi:hypothetical protein